MLRERETQSLFDGYHFERRDNNSPISPRKAITNSSTNHTEEAYRRR